MIPERLILSDDGIVIFFNDVHPLKTPLPIDFTEDGKHKLVRDEQPHKA